jgi:hypothetical protein
VHAFDLAKGESAVLPLPVPQVSSVTGLAVTEDGARLFVVTQHSIYTIDLRTGTSSELVRGAYAYGAFRAGPVTTDPGKMGRFSYVMGCVIDKVTRSLVMVEYETHRIVRLRGVDV